tara:strand:+ start:230 stop:412 length:183 start_codon:yes stop_codon:yes gene_type:complete
VVNIIKEAKEAEEEKKREEEETEEEEDKEERKFRVPGWKVVSSVKAARRFEDSKRIPARE